MSEISDREKRSLWRDAIINHLEDYAQDNNMSFNGALKVAASALYRQACAGEGWALKEFGDRIDGKATQPIDANVKGNFQVQWPLPKTPLDQ